MITASNFGRLALALGVSAVLMAGLVLPQTVAQAAGEVRNGRDVFHCLEEHSVAVPDEEGHFFTLFVCSGMRFVENGEIGTFEVYGGGDYTGGAGNEIGYQVVSYPDGSTKVLKWEGIRAGETGEGEASFEGTFELIKGTGRFEGVKTKGTFKGRAIGNDGYLDWTSTTVE